jgi:hypothetical protein
MTSTSLMVNIKVPTETLRGFDHLCRLSGKTRTAVLVDLMRSFVLDEEKRIPAQVRRISTVAEAARRSILQRGERRSDDETSDPSKAPEKAIKMRFSEFLLD